MHPSRKTVDTLDAQRQMVFKRLHSAHDILAKCLHPDLPREARQIIDDTDRTPESALAMLAVLAQYGTVPSDISPKLARALADNEDYYLALAGIGEAAAEAFHIEGPCPLGNTTMHRALYNAFVYTCEPRGYTAKKTAEKRNAICDQLREELFQYVTYALGSAPTKKRKANLLCPSNDKKRERWTRIFYEAYLSPQSVGSYLPLGHVITLHPHLGDTLLTGEGSEKRQARKVLMHELIHAHTTSLNFTTTGERAVNEALTEYLAANLTGCNTTAYGELFAAISGLEKHLGVPRNSFFVHVYEDIGFHTKADPLAPVKRLGISIDTWNQMSELVMKAKPARHNHWYWEVWWQNMHPSPTS